MYVSMLMPFIKGSHDASGANIRMNRGQYRNDFSILIMKNGQKIFSNKFTINLQIISEKHINIREQLTKSCLPLRSISLFQCSYVVLL